MGSYILTVLELFTLQSIEINYSPHNLDDSSIPVINTDSRILKMGKPAIFLGGLESII